MDRDKSGNKKGSTGLENEGKGARKGQKRAEEEEEGRRIGNAWVLRWKRKEQIECMR